MGSNGAEHQILPNRATGAPAPKDAPNPVRSTSLVGRTIKTQKSKRDSASAMIHSQSSLHLTNRGGAVWAHSVASTDCARQAASVQGRTEAGPNSMLVVCNVENIVADGEGEEVVGRRRRHRDDVFRRRT